jgi:predicted DNA-binding transcriptional regulator AlpA
MKRKRNRDKSWHQRRHHLYRHFDKDGKLLYVGISLHAVGRLAGHRKDSKWFDEIAEVTIQQFANRDEAMLAERLAIADEKPAHNRKLANPLRRPHRALKRMVSEPEKTVLRMLTMDQVLELVPVGKISLRRMIKHQEFPGPHYITPNKPIWFAAEVERWQAQNAPAAPISPQLRPYPPTGARLGLN